ncbi:MAG: hypothetical protein WC788_06065 [Candidatus Paceibacterota bacterium]
MNYHKLAIRKGGVAIKRKVSEENNEKNKNLIRIVNSSGNSKAIEHLNLLFEETNWAMSHMN